MDQGECSRTRDEEGGQVLWAKLVPSSSEFVEVEIKSRDTLICSETSSSLLEKKEWCRIMRNSEENTAKIENVGTEPLLVDGNVLKQGETSTIRSGNEIVSGPDLEGYLCYKFQIVTSQEQDKKSLKISLDIEHTKCSICLNVWHDVVTVSPCLHNFCNGCFSEWMRRCSKRSFDNQKIIVCPQCRATVQSVGRNHFLRYVEEAILQNCCSLKRSEDEIATLDVYASVKSNMTLDGKGLTSRKRPSFVLSSDDGSDEELPCPQCGTEINRFRCSSNTNHLQCQGCRGLMPRRPDTRIPQHCLGCDRAFCGVYWFAQGMDSNEFNTVCSPETFKRISERTVSRIPYSVHQNNHYEIDITERCVQQTGKSLQAVISDWMLKFNNREIDPSRLILKHADAIYSQTHLCNECFDKLVDFLLYWFRISMPKSLLPPDAINREDCWYGYSCRTQHHSPEHARKRNHVCRPTRGSPAP